MDQTPMTPFDLLTNTDSLQMLKVLLPFTPPSSQRMLAMMIKVQELDRTSRYFHGFPADVTGCDLDSGTLSPKDLLTQITPYLPPSRREALESAAQMMEMMEIMNDMNQMNHMDATHNSDTYNGGETHGAMDERSGLSEDGTCQEAAHTDGSKPDSWEEES